MPRELPTNPTAPRCTCGWRWPFLAAVLRRQRDEARAERDEARSEAMAAALEVVELNAELARLQGILDGPRAVVVSDSAWIDRTRGVRA